MFNVLKMKLIKLENCLGALNGDRLGLRVIL